MNSSCLACDIRVHWCLDRHYTIIFHGYIAIFVFFLKTLLMHEFAILGEKFVCMFVCAFLQNRYFGVEISILGDAL